MAKMPPLLGGLMLFLAAATVLPAAARGDDERRGEREWGRVGRIVELHGDVSLRDEERDEWVEALRNRPVTEGDRLVLARGARAELRIAGATLLLAQGADVEFDRLDDDQIRLQLRRGSIALAIPSRDLAEQTEVRTDEARLRPQRAGRYRIDRDDGSTFAAVWRGDLEASGDGHLLLIGAGERHELWRDERRDELRSRLARMPDDRLAAWAEETFRADERRQAEAWRYASPEIPGLEDLDRHGRWDVHPEYGPVWIPVGVGAGWQPFRDGRWVWMAAWGWTWVDAHPWGFAPSHYGRWVQWHGRWCWWPGPRHVRPVFTPAVVAWVGGPQVGVSVTIGHAPPAAWVPLAPYQPYVPVVKPRPPKPRPPAHPPQVPTGPISKPPMPAYGPNGVPQGVQPVPAARPAPMAPAPGVDAPVRPPAAAPAPFNAQSQKGQKGQKADRAEGAGRPEPRPEPRVEPRPEPRVEPRPEPRAEPRAERPDKADTRADQRRREQAQ